MNRTRYIVSYDIADPKRLRLVAKICESFGSRVQFSVFECVLSDLQVEQLRAKFQTTLNHDQDQVLFISLGPERSDSPFRIESMGIPYAQRERVTIV